MKEDKLIDALFKAAKKEAPKTSYKMVALKFTSTVGAGGWLMGAKAAFLNNVYLNSVISLITVGTIATAAYVSLDDSEAKHTEGVAQEVAYTEWYDFGNEKVERLTYSPIYTIQDEPSLETPNGEALSFGMGLNNSTYKAGEITHQKRDIISMEKAARIAAIMDSKSNQYKTIEYIEIEKLEVLEKYYKEVLKKDQSMECYADFNKFSGKEVLDNLIFNLEMNGINAEVDAKYNSSDGAIKKLKMDLSDNEGYVQRIICVGFDIMEMHWKSDSNGYPYDLQISWDNGDLYDIDLTDQRAPIYKYIDRN